MIKDLRFSFPLWSVRIFNGPTYIEDNRPLIQKISTWADALFSLGTVHYLYVSNQRKRYNVIHLHWPRPWTEKILFMSLKVYFFSCFLLLLIIIDNQKAVIFAISFLATGIFLKFLFRLKYLPTDMHLMKPRDKSRGRFIPKEQDSSLLQLPDEVRLKIFEKLSDSDLARLSQTCCSLSNLLEDRKFYTFNWNQPHFSLNTQEIPKSENTSTESYTFSAFTGELIIRYESYASSSFKGNLIISQGIKEVGTISLNWQLNSYIIGIGDFYWLEGRKKILLIDSRGNVFCLKLNENFNHYEKEFEYEISSKIRSHSKIKSFRDQILIIFNSHLLVFDPNKLKIDDLNIEHPTPDHRLEPTLWIDKNENALFVAAFNRITLWDWNGSSFKKRDSFQMGGNSKFLEDGTLETTFSKQDSWSGENVQGRYGAT